LHYDGNIGKSCNLCAGEIDRPVEKTDEEQGKTGVIQFRPCRRVMK
jgi:hypothetical protein